LFGRPKPAVGCSANGRRRRRRKKEEKEDEEEVFKTCSLLKVIVDVENLQ